MALHNFVVKKHSRKSFGRPRYGRAILLLLGGILLLCVLINAGMWAMYHGHALPNAYLGHAAVGGKSFDTLDRLTVQDVLPAQITFTKNMRHVQKSPAELGVSVNLPASLQSLKSAHRWFPVASLFKNQHAQLTMGIDQSTYTKAAASLNTSLGMPAVSQHIAFKDTAFTIVPKQDGYVVDASRLKTHLLTALRDKKSQLAVPTSIQTAKDTDNLAGPLQQLQKQLDSSVSFSYNGQKLQPGKADVGQWFAASGQSMAISGPLVSEYLARSTKKYDITVANQADLATATGYALSKGQPLGLTIVPSGDKTVIRTYCTAVRGVDSSVLAELEGKLAATYADTRGWNNNGQIAFQHVTNDCQYTVWMSAASEMTSFGSICDNYYNCQVGTNVIMNYDRWTSATPPWTATKGSLEDYHTLMIDHETGHRLGFYDNPNCPAPGSPAPVMMQQSIDLKGCTFNIWPLPTELTDLNAKLGL